MTQDYRTPAAFIQAVQYRLHISRFAHDFAATANNSQAPTWFDEATDALRVPRWDVVIEAGGGGWGWLNPPYTDLGPWARRCGETGRLGSHIALLVPASVGANWYRDFVYRQALVLALNGRLAFLLDKPTWLYPKDSLLCLFGPSIMPDFEVWRWKREETRGESDVEV